MTRWLIAFAFTQLVECPVYWSTMDDQKWSATKKLIIAFGASAITHPFVWFGFPLLWAVTGEIGGYWGMVVAAETFAVVVEGIYLWRLGVRRALLWALVANGASVTLGLISRWLFGLP